MRAIPPICLLALLLSACAAPPVQTAVVAVPKPCVQDGVASWYGPHPGQTRMADGKLLDPKALTAAHRSLPFGTMVRVTDLDSGRSVVVRITDRGPASLSRVIDLSPAAAGRLDMRKDGTAHVRLEIDGAGAADGGVCPLPVLRSPSAPRR